MQFSARCRMEGAAHETKSACLCSQRAFHCSPKMLPKSGDVLPQGIMPGSQHIPLKKTTQPSAYNHCISWEWGIWGLRLRHHALLFFCFYQSMLAGVRGAGVRQLKQSVLFNSMLLQPCGVLAAGGVSTGVGWAAAHVRWDLDRAAAAALSCLALGLSSS